MVKNIDIGLVLLFVMIVYLINDIYNRKKEVVIKKNSIRPSYSNEFWNYNQGKNKEEEYIIKDRYNIY